MSVDERFDDGGVGEAMEVSWLAFSTIIDIGGEGIGPERIHSP